MILAIIVSLLLVGAIIWACSAETPAIVACREVDEDEPYAPTEWGPGDEF